MPAPRVVVKPKPPPAVTPMLPNPTISRILVEPLFVLKQQAAEGNRMAIQLLAHEQPWNPKQQPAAITAGSVPEFGAINIIAE